MGDLSLRKLALLLFPESGADDATRVAFEAEALESNTRLLRRILLVSPPLHILGILVFLRAYRATPAQATWLLGNSLISAALIVLLIVAAIALWRGVSDAAFRRISEAVSAAYVVGAAAMSANAQRGHPNFHVFIISAFFVGFAVRIRPRAYALAVLAGAALVLVAMARYQTEATARNADVVTLTGASAIALFGFFVARTMRFRELVSRRRVEALNAELRVTNEALVYARDAAEAGSRAKSAFLAHMSHEIRTPMNAVLGYAQLLQRDGTLRQSQRAHVDHIGRSGEHLLGLINGVLEASKIEAGRSVVARGEVDLGALVGDLGEMFLLRADEKRLAFEVVAPDLPRRIVSDEGKLRQVLFNLLANAVKFTEAGGVTARVSVRSAGAGRALLVAEVEDTGPGLTEEAIAGLFQPFGQARPGERAQGGAGVGLTISRAFARLLGGDVTVESRLGSGSVFRLQVPVEISAVRDAEPVTSAMPAEPAVPAGAPPRGARSGTRRAVRPRVLARLPPDVADPLREAARVADYDRMLALIDALPAQYADAAEALRSLAETFAYEQIEAVLRG